MAYIIVGMSGGVDSSVAAHLLIKQGHKVEGLFMKNWEEEDGSCQATEDLQDAQSVCDKLGIKLHKINFAAEYWDNVFVHFIDEYKAGRTPNPDILCNSEIKFKYFVDFAKNLGADKIATGHYAGIRADTDSSINLVKGKDKSKDQSYFLYNLSQAQLSSAIFPLQDLEKSQIRSIAKDLGLITHNKKDSTGICFIGPKKFRKFLQTYIPTQEGNIVTISGKILGKHNGCMYYTVGQRSGLEIGGQSDFPDKPWYVVGKDVELNQVIVEQGNDNEYLFSHSLSLDKVHWINPEKEIIYPFQCKAKIRYRQEDQDCMLNKNKDNYTVTFKQPQRAISLGQSAVFYENDTCLGGGIITNVDGCINRLPINMGVINNENR